MLRSRPRLLIGGGGTPRSYRIAARFADELGKAQDANKKANADESAKTLGDLDKQASDDDQGFVGPALAGVVIALAGVGAATTPRH